MFYSKYGYNSWPLFKIYYWVFSISTWKNSSCWWLPYGRVIWKKKKKNKTRYLSFKASTFRFCLLYLVSISRRYWEQNIKCSFIIYAFTIDPSLLGEPCFLHKSYKSLKPWMRTKVIEIFFKLLKKSKFWNWI